MSSTRKIALVTGVLFVVTFITAIPAQLFLYQPLLNDPNYIVGAGADMRVSLGALLEVILVVANIGTAIVLYPIVKRQHEAVALGYVAARVLESAVIMVGIFSVLSVMTLRRTSRRLPAQMPPRSSPLGARWSRSMTGRFCLGADSLPASGMGYCWAT